MTAPGEPRPQLIAKGNLRPLQEKQGVHELEPKSDDGEVSGLCETTTQIHCGGLPPLGVRDFTRLTQQKSATQGLLFVQLFVPPVKNEVKSPSKNMIMIKRGRCTS